MTLEEAGGADGPAGDRDRAARATYLSALHARMLAAGPGVRWRDEPGTLVFFDVSGFTPLTERLAARGKEGGEELTDILNRIFSSLLEAAEHYGGDTLKFGGDALLLHFEGDGHELRATAAAWAMQGVMRGTRRLRTSVGVVSLGASCGIASGPVHAFLVGETFRELVIAGPTTTAALTMEKDASSGEILVSPSVAERLPGAVLGHAHAGGGRPVIAGPDAPARAVVDVDEADESATEVLTGGIQPVLLPYLQYTADGEHRQVSVAFLQFQGVDERIAAEGGDATCTALHGLITGVQQACDRHGITFLGTDCDRGSGKVMLTTGAPVAGPHDADALVLGLAAIMATPLELPIRAGANRGRVFAMHLGSADRRTYTTMGEATNLAARVMGRSEPGRLLATRSLLERTTAPLGLETIPPFKVKGVSAAVHAAFVAGVDGDERRSVWTSEPLLGREPELAQLRALLGRAAEGLPGAILLLGEPGIGKTRLLGQAVHEAERLGLAVVRVAGRSYDSDRVYSSVRDSLRRLVAGPDASSQEVGRAVAARLPAEAQRWLPLVGIPFGLTLPPSPEQRALSPTAARARLHVEILPVLADLVIAGTVLAIEDTQWVDEASRELLQALLTAPGGPAIATILAGREAPVGLRPPATEVIELGPLSDAAVEALLAHDAEVRQPLQPAVAQIVAERAHGHPLFLYELLRAAHAGHDLEDLPDSVEALITVRIDVLAPADRALLREAAVLGTRFQEPLLGEMADMPDGLLEPALGRLSDFVIRDHGIRWTFHQALARDAAYEALPYRRRRELHRRAAELIERQAGQDVAEVASRLSLHSDAAGDHERSWRYSRIAADLAESQGAPVEAAVYLRRALAAAHSLGELSAGARADVAQRLGDMCELAGLYDHADTAYRQARKLASGDEVREADLCRRQGWLRERTGSYSQALRWYSRGLKLVDGRRGVTATRLQGRLVLAYGAARLRQGRLVDAVEPLERAIGLAERTDDRESLAHASYLLDWAYTDLGRPQEHFREQALAIYTELQDWTGLANVLNNLGVNAFFAGDWKAAEELYERSQEARQRGGDLVRYGEALHNMGELLVDQGRLHEAEPRLRRALSLWRGAGFPVGVGVALMNLGRAAARRGDDDVAGALFEQAREQLGGIGSEQTVDLSIREGEWHALSRRTEEASAVLEEARREAARRGGAPVLLAQIDRLRGAVAAQRGDYDAALGHLADSLRVAKDTRYEEALTSDLLARVSALAGVDVDPSLAPSAAETFADLGVVRTWTAPLVSAVGQ